MIIKTIGFQKIDNVEAIGPSRSRILNTEVVPLSVTSCAIVRLQYQIIFKFIDLNGSSQVT